MINTYFSERFCGLWLTLSLAMLTTGSWAADPVNFTKSPASFEISKDIVNEGLEPFVVTRGQFGNALRHRGQGGFEPEMYRNKFAAIADSPNRIYLGEELAHFDIYQSGYLDGANVLVFRIVNGKMTLIREDTVPKGGCVIEGWTGAPVEGAQQLRLISTETTQGEFVWDAGSRPNTSMWFTVFSVDRDGNASEAAPFVQLNRVQPAHGAKAINNIINLRSKQGKNKRTPPTPQNFRAEVNAQGVVKMSWDAVKDDGLAGYAIAHSDTDPAKQRGNFLQLSHEASDPTQYILQGDLVFVSRSMIEFSPDWISNRRGKVEKFIKWSVAGVPDSFLPDAEPGKTWRLLKHSEDTPVPDAGEYYLEMTLREGDMEMIGKNGGADIGNTNQSYYPVPDEGKEYVMEVWMKADRVDAPPVVFTWDGAEAVGSCVGVHPLQLTSKWKKYEARFIGHTATKGLAHLVLKCQGPATYSIDNYHVRRSDAGYLEMLPYEIKALQETGMAALRTHAPIKTGISTYSMRSYLGSPGNAAGVTKGISLPQNLKMIEMAGIRPWLQLEFHMSPEEWLSFAEYMAAPYDPAKDSPATKPWAALRYNQGHPKPWVDSFDRIYFELGNETWNPAFSPWNFYNKMTDSVTGKEYIGGEVHGKFLDYVVGVIRSSPYWTSEVDQKFIPVLGGWSVITYSRKSVEGSDTAQFVTVGGYNGGWDEGEGPPKMDPVSHFNVLSQVYQSAMPRILDDAKMAIEFREKGKDIRLGTYEAGPGYALNGLNNAKVSAKQAAEQELVMKSKLAGTATLDSWLARAYFDYDIQNFFTFGGGERWKSHAEIWRGGQPHACFIPLMLFNHEGTGDMLKIVTQSTPTVDTPAFKRRKSIVGAPLAAVYATRKEDRVNVFCISRKVPDYPVKGDDGYTPFSVKLPFSTAKSITLFRLTGSPTENNIMSENVKLESIDIDPAVMTNNNFTVNKITGGDERGLPPSEMYLYVFKGTDIGSRGRVCPLSETVAEAEKLNQKNPKKKK